MFEKKMHTERSFQTKQQHTSRKSHIRHTYSYNCMVNNSQLVYTKKVSVNIKILIQQWSNLKLMKIQRECDY